jgi:hypothetical protein
VGTAVMASMYSHLVVGPSLKAGKREQTRGTRLPPLSELKISSISMASPLHFELASLSIFFLQNTNSDGCN